MSDRFIPLSALRTVVRAESISEDAVECALGQDPSTRVLMKDELRWPEQAKLLHSARHLLEGRFDLPKGALRVGISLKDITQTSSMMTVAAGLSLYLRDASISNEIHSSLQAEARAFIESMQHYGEVEALTPGSLEIRVESAGAHPETTPSAAATPPDDGPSIETSSAETTPDCLTEARSMIAGRQIARPFIVTVGEGASIELSERFRRQNLPPQTIRTLVVLGEIDSISKRRSSFTFLVSGTPVNECPKRLDVLFEPLQLARAHEMHLESDVTLTVEWTQDFKPNGLPGHRFAFVAIQTSLACAA